MNKHLIEPLSQKMPVTFTYCGKTIQVTAETRLDDLQAAFGHDLDVLDLCRASWQPAPETGDYQPSDYEQLVREHADLVHYKQLAETYLTEEQRDALQEELDDLPEPVM